MDTNRRSGLRQKVTALIDRCRKVQPRVKRFGSKVDRSSAGGLVEPGQQHLCKQSGLSHYEDCGFRCDACRQGSSMPSPLSVPEVVDEHCLFLCVLLDLAEYLATRQVGIHFFWK